jgi:Haem-degrading
MKTRTTISFGLLIALLWATAGNAQVADKKVLTLEGAKRVIAAAEAQARQVNAPGAVIAVVDDGANLIALERLDATFSAGANVSIGKGEAHGGSLASTICLRHSMRRRETREGAGILGRRSLRRNL